MRMPTSRFRTEIDRTMQRMENASIEIFTIFQNLVAKKKKNFDRNKIQTETPNEGKMARQMVKLTTTNKK